MAVFFSYLKDEAAARQFMEDFPDPATRREMLAYCAASIPDSHLARTLGVPEGERVVGLDHYRLGETRVPEPAEIFAWPASPTLFTFDKAGALITLG